MSVYLKEIPDGNRSINPYKLYKTWMFDTTSSFTNATSSGIIGVYNARYVTGSQLYSNPGSNIITDQQGYPINVTYGLDNGTFYSPYDEFNIPYNFPNGTVTRYAGGEFRFVDGLYWGATSGSYKLTGYSGRNIWYAIYNLFYRKSQNTEENKYPYDAVYIDEFDGTNTLYTSSAAVFSIPRIKYGEGILKESFEMILTGTSSAIIPYSSAGNTAGNIDIYDNGKGNLYDKYNTVYSGSMGNISYDKGLVIITNPEYYEFMSSSLFIKENTGSMSIEFSYTSYITVTQHSYTCIVKSYEFNTTSNITAYQSRESGVMPIDDTTDYFDGTKYKYIFNDAVDSSGNFINFRPLMTSIGLYDDLGKLMAIAKSANPIRIENDIDSIFVVRFDM
jgi:hypothetical protein